MEDVYIVAAKRTPVGAFQGELSGVPAPRLGAVAIKAVMSELDMPVSLVDECIMGQVLTAGSGQAPARQAALYAGLPVSVACMTVNKVCGSGLKAVMLANDAIRLGTAQVVIAGGQENMSLAPHLLEASRSGYRMGDISATDSMIRDGLWDPYSNSHMGMACEQCAMEYGFSREQQDAYAIRSYERAQSAIEDGAFDRELCAVETLQGKLAHTVKLDEEPGKARFDKLLALRPAFSPDGTITAGNASKVNDGAAALMLVSAAKLQELGLKPMARIVAQASFSQEPQRFTTAPVGAIKKVLGIANLNINQIDLFEINEAFSTVALAVMQELDIPASRVNIHGGAVALGHPIGASGARILTTLVHAMERYNKQTGLATVCIGGGEAVAVIVERNLS